MKTVTDVPKPAPTRVIPKRSALSAAAARCSGTVVSLLVHGTFVLLAFLSVAGPRAGRGGGTVGRPDGGSGPRDFSAQLRTEAGIDVERSPEERVYPPLEPEPEETPEAVPPPPEDFLKELSETGIPLAKIPAAAEPPLPSRSRDAYTRLPPSAESEPEESSSPGIGQKGDSTVKGSGGDTGGAGDGTSGALYMPAPEYPASARRRGIEGVAVVEVQVSPDGHCERPQLAQSSGCPALDEAALSAIRKWKYEARPEEGTILRRVRFVFRLQR
jgi:TonB family protein